MDDAPDDADSQDIGTEQSNILDTSAGEEELAEKIVNVALSPVVRQKPNPDPKPVQEDKSGIKNPAGFFITKKSPAHP